MQNENVKLKIKKEVVDVILYLVLNKVALITQRSNGECLRIPAHF